MSSRIATGPIGVSDSIRARIRTDPSLLEEGLRLLDEDVQAGAIGSIDAIAVDRAGRLVIVSIAPADIDRSIARLLDLQIWATDQRDLLGRLYARQGVAVDRPARFLLLAPALPHALLRRLALLPIDVTLLLARPVVFEDGTRIAIEAAASILGLADGAVLPEHTRPAAHSRPATPDGPVEPERPGPPDRAAVSSERSAAPDWTAVPDRPAASTAPSSSLSATSTGREAPAPGATPFWPDEVLPPEYADEKTIPIPPTMELDEAEPAWPGTPEDRFPWELPGDPLAPQDELEASGEASEAVFETLTAEEMREFARFEKQRRERDGRHS